MHAKVDQRLTINLVDATIDGIRKNRGKNMALKKLNQFNYFDAEEFFSKLSLIAVGKATWKEFGSGNVLGTKVEVVIAGDKHNYNTQDGDVVNNMYEKLIVKIARDIDVPMNAKVRLVNPKANIYGEYRNQLSVTAEDIEVLGK